MGLSPDAKERLGVVFEVVKTAFHWGFIPTVLYLGELPRLFFFLSKHHLNLTLKILIVLYLNLLFLLCRIQERI